MRSSIEEEWWASFTTLHRGPSRYLPVCTPCGVFATRGAAYTCHRLLTDITCKICKSLREHKDSFKIHNNSKSFARRLLQHPSIGSAPCISLGSKLSSHAVVISNVFKFSVTLLLRYVLLYLYCCAWRPRLYFVRAHVRAWFCILYSSVYNTFHIHCVTYWFELFHCATTIPLFLFFLN